MQKIQTQEEENYRTRAEQHAAEKGWLLKESIKAAEEVRQKDDKEALAQAIKLSLEEQQEAEFAKEVKREEERAAGTVAAPAAQVATSPPLRVFDPWLQ
eukprot:6188980-Heterocapsa_arctica.AAC.1